MVLNLWNGCDLSRDRKGKTDYGLLAGEGIGESAAFG
jgi:hypothetical protein